MSAFTADEARALLTRVMALSRAEACEANLIANVGGNIRYARNTVTTAGATSDRTLVVQSNFGKRSGTATINEFDDAALERVVRRSEELARLAPEDPEFMGPLPPQEYVATEGWVDATASVTPEYRARVAEASIAAAKARDCVAAGFFNGGAAWQAMMNTKGLFAYYRNTNMNFTVTMRTADGTGSGYALRDFNDVAKFDAAAASRVAVEKAAASREARAIEPGKYTVILEPEAAAGLIQFMMFNFDARSADEGRSFLAKPGGGTRVGEKLVDERITVYSDPQSPDLPSSPWGGDGRAMRRRNWIENGVARQLYYSRYWAAKQGVEAVPFPTNLAMAGGEASVEQLIRETPRGILLTRTWYIRPVDPQTVLLTGLTRDGTFYIENGAIKHAVKNLRFNESPVIMLNNLDALGRVERVNGEFGFPCLIPAIRVRDFTFTSLSDAV